MSEMWLLAGFFVFVMAAVSFAGYWMSGRSRQVEVTGPANAQPSLVMRGTGKTRLAGLIHLFQIVGQAVPGAREESNPLRARLLQAGYRHPSSVHIFYGIKCASALTLGVLVIWLALAFDANAFVPFLAAAAFGFLLPDRVLDRVVKRRSFRLRHGLPAALDMLVLAVEAGQSLDQALVAAARGLKTTHPDLAFELTLLHLEARTSNNRAEALHNFAIRTKDRETKKFAGLLIDTDRFGTSVGPALRDHAKYLRIRFRQQAQETARKVGVKLIFPVFFLIFPSVLLVTLGPAVILITTQLKDLVGR